MNDGDDLLGKADALLAKYRSSPAPDFPVLTEVVELPAVPVPKPPEPTDGLANTRSETLDLEIHDLEARLRGQLLIAIEPYIVNCLEEQLRERIKAQVDVALARVVDDLTSAIRTETTTLVGVAIAKAVEQELAEFRAQLGQP